jgi:hypothetical protein
VPIGVTQTATGRGGFTAHRPKTDEVNVAGSQTRQVQPNHYHRSHHDDPEPHCTAARSTRRVPKIREFNRRKC